MSLQSILLQANTGTLFVPFVAFYNAKYLPPPRLFRSTSPTQYTAVVFFVSDFLVVFVWWFFWFFFFFLALVFSGSPESRWMNCPISFSSSGNDYLMKAILLAAHWITCFFFFLPSSPLSCSMTHHLTNISLPPW